MTICNPRVALSELYTMTASVISAAFVPDPSAQGLFGAPPQIRQRVYQDLPGNFRYSNHVPSYSQTDGPFPTSSFKIGDEPSAVFHIGVVLNPLSEVAQKWAPMITVRFWYSSRICVALTCITVAFRNAPHSYTCATDHCANDSGALRR